MDFYRLKKYKNKNKYINYVQLFKNKLIYSILYIKYRYKATWSFAGYI